MKMLKKLAFAMAILAGIAIFLWLIFVGVSNVKEQKPTWVAFWIGHEWVAGPTARWIELKQKLIDHSYVDALYFHVGPLNADGSLPLITVPMLSELPTQNLAWVGQVRSEIPLEKPEVRARIIAEAAQLTAQGFDGIHIDIEPVRRDDTDFIKLIQELRQAQPSLYISVAMDEWQPHLLSQLLARWLGRPIESYWSTEQVRAVAKNVDELVVMTYDTNLQDPKFYQLLVKFETIYLSKILPANCKLRVGLPVYDKGESLNPAVENLDVGLQGYHLGVTNSLARTQQITGIALYPLWEMQDHEWELLDQYETHFSEWLQALR